ncbi:hypothetical protein [Flavobacterium flabelliforme]|uniref:hypothetical protein n=1 Tax=Flavobacterium flabelliforme TaxID=2816119 RepID=UPI001B31E56A|nr:hypothetical protein [Flavobacterium flabelliforme]
MDSVFVSDDTLEEVNGKNENSYHAPKKVEVVSAQSTVKYVPGMHMPSTLSEAYHIQDSISSYSSPVTDNIIDPDWKKLITRVGND